MLLESENDRLKGLVLSKAHEGVFSGGAINALGFSGETIEQACRMAARNISQQTNKLKRGSTSELVFRNLDGFDIEIYTWSDMLGLGRSNGYYG